MPEGGAVGPSSAVGAEQQSPGEVPLEVLARDFQQARSAGDAELAAHIGGLIQKSTARERQRDVESIPHSLPAGVGHGLVELGMDAGDALGGVSPQAWREFRDDSAPLMSTTGGKVGSVVGQAAALAPVGSLVEGAMGAAGVGRALPRVAEWLKGAPLTRAAASGAAQGALASPGRRLEGAAEGALGGAATAAVLGGGRRALRGQEPTPEAALLEREGVPLTVGQRNPTGQFGGNVVTGEDAGQKMPLVAPLLVRAREAARRGYQNAVARKGTAPGAPPPDPALPMDEQLQQVAEGYEVPYGKLKGQQVYPSVKTPQGGRSLLSTTTGRSPGLIEEAAMDLDVPASEETRKRANDWLQNQLSILPGGKNRPPVAQTVPAEDIHRIRSNVREMVRKRGTSSAHGDQDFADLVDAAEGHLTDTLNSWLPPDVAQGIAAADKRYVVKSIVEDAVARAKDRPEGLTPNNLSEAIRATTEKGKYARGQHAPQVKELRDLAQAGRSVLDQRTPNTGALILGGVNAPLAYLANHPALKPMVTGKLGVQRAFRKLEDFMRQHGGQSVIPRAAGAAGGQMSREDLQE
jgi:hypothetical protein